MMPHAFNTKILLCCSFGLLFALTGCLSHPPAEAPDPYLSIIHVNQTDAQIINEANQWFKLHLNTNADISFKHPNDLWQRTTVLAKILYPCDGSDYCTPYDHAELFFLAGAAARQGEGKIKFKSSFMAYPVGHPKNAMSLNDNEKITDPRLQADIDQ